MRINPTVNTMQEENYPLGKFSDRLKMAIRQKGITQKELSARINLSPVTISRYMSDDSRLPGAWDLYRMANSLGVSMEWLLTGENQSGEVSWKHRAEEAEARLSAFRSGMKTLTKTVSSLSNLLTE